MARSNFIVRGGADFSGIKKELTKTQAQLQGFQAKVSSIMKGIGTVLGSLAVGKLIKDSTKAAMGVESAIDNISRNMGNAAKAFQNWVDTQSKTLGMAKADAYTYGSTFSNLLSSFTSGAEDTAQKTQELMKAAAIIASKTGRTYEDVSDRIRSGMLGSTEAIEDLGVYVQVSMLESTEAFKKFAGNKSWNQLSYQTQQQIRLAAILEQTYKRYGDTLADTTQTRQAQFIASLNDIKLSLGQAFLPIYNAILPALTALADTISNIVSIFAQFTQALFGKANTSQQIKTTQEQATAMTELGDATEKAGKQAKKSLMGFDEINQITEDTSENTEDTTSNLATTGTTAGLTVMDEATESEESSRIQEFAEKIKTTFEPVIAAFEKIKAAAEPLIMNIGQGLKWFYDNILVPFGAWALAEAIPTFFNLLASALILLNPILEVFKSLGQWLWENFLQSIAQWTGDTFIAAMNSISDIFEKFGNWITQNQEQVVTGLAAILSGILAFKTIKTLFDTISTVKKAVSGLSAAFSILSNPILLIIAVIAALVAGFVYFYTTNEKFRGVVDGVLNQIKDVAVNLWQNVLKPFGEFLSDVFVVAWDAVKKAAEWLWQNVLVPLGDFFVWLWKEVLEPVGSVLINWLGMAFQNVADIAKLFWKNVLVPLGNALKEMFKPTVEAVSAVLSFLWNKVFKPFGEFLISVFKPIIEGLIDVFVYLWNNVFKPLGEFISNVFIGIFDNMFNSIGTIINGLKNIFIGLMNFITGAFTGNWEKAWEGVKQIFKGIFDSLWGIVKFPLNLIIDGINAVIGALNSLSIDIPDWVPIFGGHTWGINIPKIPKLARGGIITEPTLAMVGERGPEAVVPLENTGFVDAIASAVGSAVLAAMQVATSSSNTNDKEIVINIDGIKMARILIPKINNEVQRMGYRPILQTGGSGI